MAGNSWIKKVRVGDKVRYLGGDPADKNALTIGEKYRVNFISGDGGFYISNDKHKDWYVGRAGQNAGCFELIKNNSDDVTANLARTVSQLERELNDLKLKYEIDREMFIDDIAMIDERTQPDDSAANLVRKTVTYEYER